MNNNNHKKYKFIFLFIVHVFTQYSFANENIKYKEPRRDPFKPFLLIPCNQGLDKIKKWKLKGVLGKENNYKAWVINQNGEWHQLKTKEFILTNWEINKITLNRMNMNYISVYHPEKKDIHKHCEKNLSEIALFLD
ncbi:hypothetical protein [Candidatus Hamiltonella defensa]|uniref:Uncharacterized protein n=1 Tax=Hamiltonella defensa subsp. Acyrthosiphon pisum (strain 5AT) TaxID=572265 RepID=C4K8E8_HAMD5|nr:hypothetical protein [Candidatus Hamiltonella defensa]ACQ68804.1 hypothetical protein HDEF_2263 [Candidatus Hamiltonella defensa 5AT (Acyrthosiphon pisum)]ATW23316.1 hypothetical protein BJP44_10020 [Candidatus Hamiltonella defensa]